jgi:hypothetical protein
MTKKFEKLCHSAYGFSVGNMLHRQNVRRQNEMSPSTFYTVYVSDIIVGAGVELR